MARISIKHERGSFFLRWVCGLAAILQLCQGRWPRFLGTAGAIGDLWPATSKCGASFATTFGSKVPWNRAFYKTLFCSSHSERTELDRLRRLGIAVSDFRCLLASRSVRNHYYVCSIHHPETFKSRRIAPKSINFWMRTPAATIINQVVDRFGITAVSPSVTKSDRLTLTATNPGFSDQTSLLSRASDFHFSVFREIATTTTHYAANAPAAIFFSFRMNLHVRIFLLFLWLAVWLAKRSNDSLLGIIAF